MEQSVTGKSDSKKVKPTAKRSIHQTKNVIFTELAEGESDPQWEERFQKMAIGRFPGKIKWNPTVDTSDNPPDVQPENFYGELIYVNRQQIKKLRLSKEDNLQNIRVEIKAFIQNYTNVDMEQKEDEIANEGIQVIPKNRIVPVSWIKLAAKDQAIALNDYVKSFAIENNLTKEEHDNFSRYLTIFGMGRNITPFIVFDKDGTIEKLKGIVKESGSSDGPKYVYRLKS
jgi:hypothetical protein